MNNQLENSKKKQKTNYQNVILYVFLITYIDNVYSMYKYAQTYTKISKIPFLIIMYYRSTNIPTLDMKTHCILRTSCFEQKLH